MNLHDYFNSPGSLSASELAERIDVKSVAQIRQWQHGYANRLPSPENCYSIEQATDGKVTRQDLRPNDFWKIWPDLAHLHTPTDPAHGDTAKPAQDDALSDSAQPVLLVPGDRRHESHLPDPDLERREAAAADLQAKEDGEAGKRK